MAIEEDHFTDRPELDSALQQQTIEFSNIVQPFEQPSIDSVGVGNNGKNNGTIGGNNVAVETSSALKQQNWSSNSVFVYKEVNNTDSTIQSSTDSSEKPQQITEIANHQCHQQPLLMSMSTGEGIMTVPTKSPRRMAIDEDHFVDPPEQEATQQQQTIEPSSNCVHDPEPIQSPTNDSLVEKNSDTIVCNNMGTSTGASSLAPPSSSNIKLEKEKSTSVPISDGMTDASTAIIPLDETVSNSNSSSGKAKAKEQNMFWLMPFDLKEDVINEFRPASMSSAIILSKVKL